jgi:hypothetical protein
MHLDIARSLTIALAVAVVTVAACEARTVPSPVEAGFPSDLINTPVCAAVESFDDARNCRITGWPEGRNRAPYRPMR